LAATARSQAAVRITVADAVAKARALHPQLAPVTALRRTREAEVRGSLAAYLPVVSTEWSAIRTDDPVAVFGAKLRQGRFGAGDLALAALNQPAAVSNFGVSVTVEQPLIAPEGWFGRRAALAGADAGRLAELRAQQIVGLDALVAYFAAAVVAAKVEVLDSALAAGRSTLRQVESLRREGVVTAVDDQLARARVSELEAGREMATAERIAAVDRLLITMGELPGQSVDLADPLSLAATEPDSGPRADLEALRSALRAQQANLARVRAQRLPSAGAFGSVAFNDRTLGAVSGPRHWTAGIMVRWTPFRGFRDLAQADQARAEADRAAADLDAAERAAAAEVRAAEARLGAAKAALAATDRALTHAAEAARIATTRYAGGVATISELLSVRASESNQRLARLEALFQARIAQAQVAVARGGNP
jgi:outer membrane protein TolC